MTVSVTVSLLCPDAFLPEQDDRWLACLSAEEKARADRFLRPANRREFIAAHALKRQMLAQALCIPPDALRFGTEDAHGKPCVLNAPRPVNFNLSHTTGQVGCAVTLDPDVSVGLDLEEADRRTTATLADRFFADDETAWIHAQPDPLRAFLSVWTLKEAFVKAAGRGLSLGLETFSVRPPDGPDAPPVRPPDGPDTPLTRPPDDPDTPPHPRPAFLLRQDPLAVLDHRVQLWQWTSDANHLVSLAVVTDRPVAVVLSPPPE